MEIQIKIKAFIFSIIHFAIILQLFHSLYIYTYIEITKKTINNNAYLSDDRFIFNRFIFN